MKFTADELVELLQIHGLYALTVQNSNGSFNPDRNGPWQEEMTPVRITCHWLITLLACFKHSGDERFLDSAKKAIRYIKRKENRPFSAVFHCSTEKRKNPTNGLVGQAWVCEALLEVYELLKNSESLAIAKSIIDSHYYDEELNLWYNCDLSGRNAGLNRTLNQQIFFSSIATVIAEIADCETLKRRCARFWDNIPSYIKWNKEGLINHKLRIRNRSLKPYMLRQFLDQKDWYRHSYGYLSFILYGLSVGKYLLETSAVLSNGKILKIVEKAVSYIDARFPFFCGERVDDFCWSYNPTGIEMAFTLSQFGDQLPSKLRSHDWLDLQFKIYSDESWLLGNNAIDTSILRARFYELTRLINHELTSN